MRLQIIQTGGSGGTRARQCLLFRPRRKAERSQRYSRTAILYFLFKDDTDEIFYELSLDEVKAPVSGGDAVGTVTVYKTMWRRIT